MRSKRARTWEKISMNLGDEPESRKQELGKENFARKKQDILRNSTTLLSFKKYMFWHP